MDENTYAASLRAFQLLIVTILVALGGLSSCLSLWIVPLTARLPPRLAVRQFTLTFTWGGEILLPTSRVLGASLLAISFATSRLSDPVQADQWKAWLSLFAFLVPVAVWETVLIFPINDRVEEIGAELEKGREEDDAKKELQGLLKKWQTRNFARVAWPVLTGVGGILVMLG